MIRNLKILIAAAIAPMALGAFGATGAHAAEEKLHCSIEPCKLTLKQDGFGLTSHHVFVIKGESNAGVKGSTVSFTCESLTGETTAWTKTVTEASFSVTYDNCKAAGELVTVSMNSCNYRFTSAGGGTLAGSQGHLACITTGDGIDIAIKGTVCVKVTPLTATGIKYHDASFPSKKEEITAEVTNVVLPSGAIDLQNVANAHCTAVNLKTVEEAKYTTGHTNVTGEASILEMTNVWFE